MAKKRAGTGTVGTQRVVKVAGAPKSGGGAKAGGKGKALTLSERFSIIAKTKGAATSGTARRKEAAASVSKKNRMAKQMAARTGQQMDMVTAPVGTKRKGKKAKKGGATPKEAEKLPDKDALDTDMEGYWKTAGAEPTAPAEQAADTAADAAVLDGVPDSDTQMGPAGP